MKNNKKYSFLTVIVIIFLAFVASLFGAVFTHYYLFTNSSISYLNREVNLNDLGSGRSNIVINDVKKVVVNQDIKITETVNSLRTSLFRVYKKIDKKSITNYYDLDNPLFISLAISSDGWLLATIPNKVSNAFSPKEYVAISSDKQVYEIDKKINITGLPGELVFFHLLKANNLKIRDNITRNNIFLGKSVLVLKDYNNILLSSISSFRKEIGVYNSDKVNSYLQIANVLQKNFSNSFVFDLAGHLVAIIDSNNNIIPAFNYNYYWKSFFEDKSITRASLGVSYLDLSKTKRLDSGNGKGAWIINLSRRAIVKNSPADLAGLKEGDIITWVDDNEINSQNDLSDIISQYKPGDIIDVVYLRDGKEYNINIKLSN